MVFNITMPDYRTVFTASIPPRDLSAGRYIDELHLEFDLLQNTSTAITVVAGLALVDPFEVSLKGSPCIQINGEDLYAFNTLVLGHSPLTFVSASDDQGTTIAGLRIPLWQPPRASGELKYRVTRVAVANSDGETISVSEKAIVNPMPNEVLSPKYLHYVTLPQTTAGAVGFGTNVQFGRINGELEGILFRQANPPSATNPINSASIARINIFANEVMIGTAELGTNLYADPKTWQALWTSPADATILDNYAFLSLARSPIPRGTNVRLDIETQDASDAVRITPLYAI